MSDGTGGSLRLFRNAEFLALAGDLVGGVLLATSGFTLTYSVLSGVTLLAAVGVFALLRDDPGGQADPQDATGVETLRLLLGRSAVRALVAFRLGLRFGKMAVTRFIPIYARMRFGMSPVLVDGILAGGKLTKSLTQGVVGGTWTDWDTNTCSSSSGSFVRARRG